MDSQASTPAGALLEHSSWVRELAHQLVRDAADADDVVQEAYLAALYRVRGGESAPRGWLARVIYNQAALRARSDRRRSARELRSARDEALPSSAELAARAEAFKRLDDAVGSLRDPYRSVLELRYYQGFSPGEIAAKQGTRASTVRSQLARAVAQVREILDERHGGERRSWACALVPLAVQSESTVVGSALSAPLVASLIAVPLVVLCVWWVSTRGERGPSRTPAVAAEPSGAREFQARAAALEFAEGGRRTVAAAIEGGASGTSNSSLRAANPDRVEGAKGRGWITLVVENERGERVEGADVVPVGLEADGRGYWRPGYAPRGRTNTSIEGGAIEFERSDDELASSASGDEPHGRTDASGELLLSYPVWADADFLASRIRFRVSHSDYATNEWRLALAPRIRVVLIHGPRLSVSGWTGSERTAIADFHVSVSGGFEPPDAQWVRDGSGRAITTRLLPGIYRVRLGHESREYGRLFSELVTVDLGTSKSIELSLELKPAARFVGRLGPEVPLPVSGGRAWALILVRSADRDVDDDVHSVLGADIRPDGEFVVEGLPRGDVQVLAVCDGWSSKLTSIESPHDSSEATTTPAYDAAPTFSLTDPMQVFTLEMERTARLDVALREPDGSSAAGVEVELALIPAWDSNQTFKWPDERVRRIVTTDAGGLACLADIPAGWHCLSIRDPRFDLPLEPRLGRTRWLHFAPGETVRESDRLEAIRRR